MSALLFNYQTTKMDQLETTPDGEHQQGSDTDHKWGANWRIDHRRHDSTPGG
jgi:hypothetical protein